MTRTLLLSLALLVSVEAAHAQSKPSLADQYADAAARIIGATLVSNTAYDNLAYLSDRVGHRISGSPQLDAAIQWAVERMKADGFENVHTEPVMVPHWVRGAESAELISPVKRPLVILGLGGTVGTPPDGITADVVEVTNWEQLDALGEKVKGKIVLYNHPMKPSGFGAYGEAVAYRGAGASRAAKYGAVAALVRSVTTVSLRTPHTGGMGYADNVPKIPAAAVTIEDAETIHRMLGRGEKVTVALKLGAQTLPDVQSANVIGELRGREKPDEVVVIGGHLDSWDVGTGSTDDGGGCIAAMEVVNVLKRLNLRPRRTIRVVLWTNEENGGRGAAGYGNAHKDELIRHVLAMESDAGVSRPYGLSAGAKDSTKAAKVLATAREIAVLLRGIGIEQVQPGGGGSDTGPILNGGAAGISVLVDDTHYFDVHHTMADTMDKISPINLSLNVAAAAVVSYIVADMPERIGE